MNKNIDDNDIDIELDFDFTPIGLAIKKAREAKKITRERLVENLGTQPDIFNLWKMRGSFRASNCLSSSLQCLTYLLTNTYSPTKKQRKAPPAGGLIRCLTH